MNFGTLFLIGICSLYASSDNYQYTYQARFENPNVIKSQYVEFHTDDDDYYGLFDLGIDFDFYYNTERDYYETSDITFNFGVNRNYLISGTTSIQYNFTLDIHGFSIVDLPNQVFTIRWSMPYEDDMLHLYVTNQTSAQLGTITYQIIPNGEEFASTYEFSFDLDMSLCADQITDFMNINQDNVGAYNNGYRDGHNDGYTEGEAVGYSDGFQDGASVDDTAIVIFNGILNIALVPINFFLAIFNWELFGINMSALVTSILSVCLVVIVVRLVTGKNAEGK